MTISFQTAGTKCARHIFLTVAVCTVLAASPYAARAEGADESALVATLQSTNSSFAAKADACAKLKRIGTKTSIKALASQLPDEKLSQSARYALESMSAPEAGEALLQAMSKTSGLIQAGIINSLAVRGEAASVPKLGKLLSAPDTDVAIAAANALGQIGGPKALGLLQAKISSSTNALHFAEVDGILNCANRLLDAGDQKDTLKAFEMLYANEKSETIRVAAFRGVLLASGKAGLSRLTDTIASGDGPSQSAALLLAPKWEGAEATTALAELLPKATIPVQLALIQCLGQRNDPAATPELVKIVNSPDAGVRASALAALGIVGDDSVVALLAEKASGTGKERAIARESLQELHRGNVTQQMLALLKTASPEAGAELLRALGGRRDTAAVPALLDTAQVGNEVEHVPALQAVGLLAGGAQIPRMVQLVQDAKTDEFRTAAADALSAVIERLQTSGAKFDASAFASAATTGNADTRLALLPICSEVVQEPVRGALRAAVADSDARIRDAGTHALCETKDAELLPDLLKLACDTNQNASRLLAIRGCVRLATQEETVKLSTAQKLKALTAISANPLDTQEKRAVLSGLGNVADETALALATPMLNDAAVKAEAEQAVVRIAAGISATSTVPAKAALEKVVAMSNNPDTKKSAQAALKTIK